MQKNSMKIALIFVLAMILSLCACTSVSVNPKANDASRKLAVQPADVDFSGILTNSENPDSSETIDDNEKVTVIVETVGTSLSEAFLESGAASLSEFASSEKGISLKADLLSVQNEVRAEMKRLGLSEEFKHSYLTLASGFSAVIEYGNLAAVRALGGVKRVILSDAYSAPDTVDSESIESFWREGTGILTNSTGYNGEGMLVAVVDSAVDFTHPAFANEPENAILSYSDVEALYEGLYGYGAVDFEASDLYRSAKIPFTFDYANMDTDTRPTRTSSLNFGGDHGTHVSGIIVGDNDIITGSAPKAQLVGMKVFRDNSGSAYTSDIVAALGDAAYIGVDAINLSLGSPCGFTEAHSEALAYVNEMYEKLRQLGIAVCASAGNSYNASVVNQSGYQSVNNPEYGVLGAPSSYDASFSVASCETVSTPFFTVNGTVFEYGCSISVTSHKIRHFSLQLLGDNEEFSAEIVPVGDKGAESAYEGVDVNGKIVLVQRGGSTFSEKARVAASRGAVALIIYGTGDYLFNPAVDDDVTLPVAGLTVHQGTMLVQMAEIEPIILTLSDGDISYPISDYSSWGPVSDLTLKPDITAPGGNVFSSVPENSGALYNYMSGTSMASPNLTGAYLTVKQYVKTVRPDATAAEARTLAYQLMMSTATLLYDKDGRIVSPRHQGSGLVNIDAAVSTDAYLTVTGSDRTKLSLGDDKNRDGVYTLNFNLVNSGDAALSYSLDVLVLADQIREDGKTIEQATRALESVKTVNVSDGSYSDGIVTVEAGKTAKIKVVIALCEEDKAYLDRFPNGTYVEGYCVFEAFGENGVDLSIPYLSFYGDFTEGNAFDKTIYETTTDYYVYPMSVYGSVPGTNGAVVLGSYGLFAVPDGYTAPIPSEEKIAISTDPDSIHNIYTVYTSLLRDVEYLEYVIRDVLTGEIYYSGYSVDVSKAHYNNGSVILTAYALDIDFTDIPVSNNQKLEIVTRATLTYDGANKVQEIVWPLTVDSEAPTLFGSTVRYEDGKTLLDLEVADNHVLQCIGFGTVDQRGEAVQAYEYSLPVENWETGKLNKITLDMTDYLKYLNDGELIVSFTDYALNSQAFYLGSILPESEEDDRSESVNGFKVGTITENNFVSASSVSDAPEISADSVTTHKQINAKGEEEYFLVSDTGVLTGYVGPAGDVVIPSDLGITSIAGTKSVFSQNKQLTSVVIPEGVTEIQNTCFFFCTKLKKIVLPSTLESMGRDAIGSCYVLESLNLQDTRCTYFANYAITSNFNLKELVFPAVEGAKTVFSYGSVGNLYGLERIEFLGDVENVNSFRSLPELKTLIFNGNVDAIFDNSFMGCTKLTTLEFKGNVGRIGDPDEFYDTSFAMHKITTLDFMGDVGGIYSCNFTNCTLLERVTFHGNVDYVSGNTFTNCKKVTEFTVAEGNDNLFIDPETRLMFNKDRTVMMKPSAWDYDGIITVPETVTELVGGQFGSGYIYLSDYSLTYNYTDSFGSSAESASQYIGTDYKYKLKGVVLHEGITNLPAACFNGCVNIETLDMSFIETDYLCDGAFANCKNLKTVLLPEGICEFGEYCFYGSGILEVSIPEDVTYLPLRTFMNCDKLETVEFNNVEEIGEYCFTNASSLKEAVAPYVCYTDICSFMNCSSLETVEFSEDMSDYYEYTYAGCTSLKSINITDSMENIYNYVFLDTYSLEEIYFSENLGKLGTGAFMNSGLKSVTINSDLYFDVTDVFCGLENLESFDFANESSYYEVIDGIVYDKSISTAILFPARLDVENPAMPDSVEAIGYGAFMNALYLREIDLGNVVEIDASAFRNSSLEKADLGNISYIGKHAFRNTNLSEITLSEVNEYVEPWAFADNDLDTVILGKGLGKFDYTFVFKNSVIENLVIEDDCEAVRVIDDKFLVGKDGTVLYEYFGNETEVTVPEGITHIMADAFLYNKDIVSVILPSTLKAIGDKAFYGCSSLATVEFRSEKAPELYGIFDAEHNLCYANFVDYAENIESGLTAIVPDAEAYDGYIWNVIFGRITERN